MTIEFSSHASVDADISGAADQGLAGELDSNQCACADKSNGTADDSTNNLFISFMKS